MKKTSCIIQEIWLPPNEILTAETSPFGFTNVIYYNTVAIYLCIYLGPVCAST